MDRQGLLLCAKYAVSPNLLGYCGPPKVSVLIDHLKEDFADKELSHILGDFETLFPYLQLIARKNKIKDPFNRRVVEAYWIGNSLLKPVDSEEYAAFSKEKLYLDKKLPKLNWQKLLTNMGRKPFLPHHAFHVFNIFKRTGKDIREQTLKTMDECRIGWGKIKIKNQKSKIKNLIVEAKSLIKTNRKQAGP